MNTPPTLQPQTPTEEDGIKAIIYLQSIVGIIEPEERARKFWNEMTQGEKDYTVRLHQVLSANL